MVSFEEMLKSLELRDVLLKFLQRSHGYLKSTYGIDMDLLQRELKMHLPKFDTQTGFLTVVLSFIFWVLTFVVLHYFIVIPFMNQNRKKGA
jgi:hypothetical protein